MFKSSKSDRFSRENYSNMTELLPQRWGWCRHVCLSSIKDAGDTIADFEAGTDKIVLRDLFQSYGLSLDFTSAIAGGYLKFKTQGNNAIVLIDADGSSGSGSAVNYITVKNVSIDDLNKAINFAF